MGGASPFRCFTIHLTKENLNLHRIASAESKIPALAGISVNPRGKFTAASNGSMLVEISTPTEGSTDKAPEPFILPAKVAQQLSKELGDAAVVEVGGDKAKPAITVKNGKKATPVAFDPIDAQYPDTQKPNLWSGKGNPVTLTCDREYLQDVLKAAAVGKSVRITLFPDRVRFESEPRDVHMAVGKPGGASEGLAVSFHSDYLRHLLGAGAIGKSVTLSLWGDRLRIESKKDDGQSARGVLMCFGPPSTGKVQAAVPAKAPATAPKPVVEKPQPPAARPKPATAPSPEPSRFRWWGKRRNTFNPKDIDPNKPPTEKQRMLYTYFLRRHGEEITPEILGSTDFVGKIEELKKGLSYDQSFATWPQWKKLNYLLLERQAEPETVCEVLNGISDIKTASEAIASWSKKSVPASSKAEADETVAA